MSKYQKIVLIILGIIICTIGLISLYLSWCASRKAEQWELYRQYGPRAEGEVWKDEMSEAYLLTAFEEKSNDIEVYLYLENNGSWEKIILRNDHGAHTTVYDLEDNMVFAGPSYMENGRLIITVNEIYNDSYNWIKKSKFIFHKSDSLNADTISYTHYYELDMD